MSDGDRGKRPEAVAAALFCVAAVFGAFILLYVLGNLNGREAERREQTPAAYSESAKAAAQRACSGREAAAAFECVYEHVEASQQQTYAEQDLNAQQRAATSALAAAITAFITLIVTGVGVWFVKRTLEATLEAVEDTGRATDAMLEANKIARETAAKAELLERIRTGAYMALGNAIVSFDDNLKPRAKLKITNEGYSPARGVEARGILVLHIFQLNFDFTFVSKPRLFGNLGIRGNLLIRLDWDERPGVRKLINIITDQPVKLTLYVDLGLKNVYKETVIERSQFAYLGMIQREGKIEMTPVPDLFEAAEKSAQGS